MSTERASFDDWVNAITKPIIGLLLGLVLGELIMLAASGSFWLAIITGVVCAVIWFGILYLHKLSDGFFNWLFGGSGVRPARELRRAPGQSWPAKVARYGLVGGMTVGCLAVFIFPQSLLEKLF